MQGGEHLVHQLFLANQRQVLIRKNRQLAAAAAELVTDLDSPEKFTCTNNIDCSRSAIEEEDSQIYEFPRGASTCSSESAANSFDQRFHSQMDTVLLTSSDPSLLLEKHRNDRSLPAKK